MMAHRDIMLLCRPEVRSLPVYNSGASIASVRAKYSPDRITKLASNENPYGASPDALQALRESVAQMALYPDPGCTALCEEIAQRNPFLEAGESPEDAAVRELREETGYRARRVERLWSAYSAPGFCEELLHFCVVHGYEIGEPEPDDDEEIELGIFTLDDLWRKIRDDELPDAKTQVAVLWALSERKS